MESRNSKQILHAGTVLNDYIGEWCALFNRKPDMAIGDAFFRMFEREDPKLLKIACAVLSATMENFPKPKHLAAALSDAKATEHVNRCGTRFGAGAKRWTETVDGSIYSYIGDPKGYKALECMKTAPRHEIDRDFSDAEGISCWFDSTTGAIFYRAKDCAEGRNFIENLRRVAGQLAIPPVPAAVIP